MKLRFAPERLLPFACIGGALLLMGSELLDTFRFEGPGPTLLQTSGGGDRHHYALLVLGLFAIAAMVVAIASGSKPAAVAVAAAGVTALLIFLVVDLPDVDQVGTFDDPNQTFLQAKAQPDDGFWVELIGALVLTVCGGALATLEGRQLRSLRPGASEASRESLPSRRARPVPPWRNAAGARSQGGESEGAADDGAAESEPERASPAGEAAAAEEDQSRPRTKSARWRKRRGAYQR